MPHSSVCNYIRGGRVKVDMKTHPFLNALFASLYIVGVVFTMSTLDGVGPNAATLLIPIAVLGLFVLSVAVMAFLFGYQPFQLYFDGQKQEAVSFFFKTLLCFACFVIFSFTALLFLSFR